MIDSQSIKTSAVRGPEKGFDMCHFQVSLALFLQLYLAQSLLSGETNASLSLFVGVHEKFYKIILCTATNVVWQQFLSIDWYLLARELALSLTSDREKWAI